jgi:hypothetical protein
MKNFLNVLSSLGGILILVLCLVFVSVIWVTIKVGGVFRGKGKGVACGRWSDRHIGTSADGGSKIEV